MHKLSIFYIRVNITYKNILIINFVFLSFLDRGVANETVIFINQILHKTFIAAT
jgi:hypothetical protein